MSWQDIILTIGNIILAASLIPSVTSDDKPALSTSLTMGGVLFVFGIVYATLSLWMTVVFVFISVTLWFMLAVQKYRQQLHSNK